MQMSPANSVYKPPSPIPFWIGIATCDMTQAATPRQNELHETAEAERPGLESTRYASVLEYTNIKLESVHAERYTHAKPATKSATTGPAILVL